MELNTQSYVITPPYTPQHSDGCITITFPSNTQYLIQSDKKISKLLAKNLYKFAKDVAISAGLEHILSWEATIVCLNADEPLEHRTYTVDFKNNKGTIISLTGISHENNKPYIHYGFDIQI